MEFYIAIDIEADGPYPGDYSMLSLGASMVEDNPKTFYVELQPISEQFEEAAMRVNGLDRENLKSCGTSPQVAMKLFSQWVQDQEKSRQARAVAVYGPAVWDGMFVHWYFRKFTGNNPFGVTGSGIDLRSYFMGLVGNPWQKTGKREIIKKLSLDVSERPPHTHNARDDAVELAWFFNELRKYQGLLTTQNKAFFLYTAERLGILPQAKWLVS